MGLVKAFDAFDTERGVRFSTYAVPVILGEIRRLFRDGGTVKVSRSVKELGIKASAVREKLLKEMGISVMAYTRAIGPVSADLTHFDKEAITSTPTCMPDHASDQKAMAYLFDVGTPAINNKYLTNIFSDGELMKVYRELRLS